MSKTLRLLRFLNPENVDGSFVPVPRFDDELLADRRVCGSKTGGGPPGICGADEVWTVAEENSEEDGPTGGADQ